MTRVGLDIAAQDAVRPAGGFDGISIAPALATAAAVIMLARPLPCESLLGPKSLKRTTAVLTIATIAVTITGFKRILLAIT